MFLSQSVILFVVATFVCQVQERLAQAQEVQLPPGNTETHDNRVV